MCVYIFVYLYACIYIRDLHGPGPGWQMGGDFSNGPGWQMRGDFPHGPSRQIKGDFSTGLAKENEFQNARAEL